MRWREKFPGRTFVSVDGVDLHYARYGKKGDPINERGFRARRRCAASPKGERATVVFVHGMGDSHVNWRESAEMLAEKGFDCVALDLKGCGYSEKPERSDYSTGALLDEILGVLDALKIRRAVMAGVSYGGHLVLRFAVLHPERVRALIVCSALAYLEPANVPIEVTLARLPFLRSIAHWFVSHRAMVKTYRRWNFSAAYDGIVERVNEHMRFLSMPGGKRAYMRIVQGLDEAMIKAAEAEHGSIRVPALLLWGDRDAFFPVIQGKRLNAAIKGSKLQIIPGGSHLFMEESPREFVSRAAPFLARALAAKKARPKPKAKRIRRRAAA